MSSSSVDQIKAKLDIVSVVSGYVKLEKSGGSLKGKCPFHNEKTPSFFVSPDRGTYYCFGCGAKGDIFTFVQEFEGLDFPGALKVLAERAGVTLEKYSGGAGTDGSGKDDTQALYSVMEQATFYFENNLGALPLGKEAVAYLEGRGMTAENMSHFHVGYADAEWRGLHDFLTSKGITLENMERAGLVKRKDTTVYDTFRSRIMFPIADSSGRVVAFSGRAFPNDPADSQPGANPPPKYLNSPETPIFRKSEVLFGLDKAKRDIRLKDYSILVEGQMDLTMLHQIGLTNTVASSGTALTSEQLIRIQRLSNRIIMAYDGDSAGFAAVIRGARIALGLGMEVKIAVMAEGSDPADMAQKDVEGLKERLKNAKHIITFVLDLVIANTADPRVRTRKIVSDVLPFVAHLSSASEQGHFIKEIAFKGEIKEDALWEDLRKVKREDVPGQQNTQSAAPPPQNSDSHATTKTDLILKKLIGILFWQSTKDPTDIDSVDIENKIVEALTGGLVTEGGDEEIQARMKFLSVKNELEKQSNALAFEAESYYNGHTNLIPDIAELISNLTEEILKKEFAEAMRLLNRAEVTKDADETKRLFARCQEISQKLNSLKK